MTRFPDPKTVINSDAFSSWCKAVESYIENFETELIHKIAAKEQKVSQRPRIIQALCPRSYLPQLEEVGLFPMPKKGNNKNNQLIFAPLAESELEKLCQRPRTLHDMDRQITVRFKRSPVYLDNERELSCYFGEHMVSYWAKHDYLPDLSFPFLPYSRKFLELELYGEGEGVALNRQESKTTLESILALIQEDADLANIEFRTDIVPVWNVRSRRLTAGPQVESTNNGIYIWRPRWTNANTNISKGACRIIHRAFDRSGNPVTVRMNAGRIESDLKFHTLEFSTLYNVKHLPSILTYPVVGTNTINVADNYWYRNYFQSFSITRSDLTMLLDLLPETKGYLRLASAELAPCSQSVFNRLISDKSPFFDYLWYIDTSKRTSDFGISGTSILELDFKAMEEGDSENNYILEDRVNYFASICDFHLPITVNAWGELK